MCPPSLAHIMIAKHGRHAAKGKGGKGVGEGGEEGKEGGGRRGRYEDPAISSNGPKIPCPSPRKCVLIYEDLERNFLSIDVGRRDRGGQTHKHTLVSGLVELRLY